MYRIVLGFEACKLEIFVNHCLHGFYAHSLIQTAQKDRFCLYVCIFLTQACNEIVGQCRLASIIEVNDTLFVAFTQQAKTVF